MRRLLQLLLLLVVVPNLQAQQTTVDDKDYNAVVDFTKIKFWVGEGENQAAFVYNGVDASNNTFGVVANLVFGYRWQGDAPSVVQMVRNIAEADKGFETVEFDGDKLTSLRYNNNPVGNKGSSPYVSENFWISDKSTPYHYVYAGEEGGSKTISDGQTIVLSTEKGTTQGAFVLPWLLYRPAVDETGLIIPDNIIYYLENGLTCNIPVFVNFPVQSYSYSIVPVEDNVLKDFLKPGTGFKFSTDSYKLTDGNYKVVMEYIPSHSRKVSML